MHARPTVAPQPRRAAPQARPDLHVVAPRRRLRTGPTVALGVLLAFGIAFALVVAQTVLVQNQQLLDEVDASIAEASRQQQELRLEVARLESPSRVVEAATAFGMVPPDTVTYLTPSPTVTLPEPDGDR